MNIEENGMMQGVELLANAMGGGVIWTIAFTLLEIIVLNKILSYINSL